MAAKPRKAVPAKVVDVDPTVEPVDAVVVADKRNTLGKRLGTFALILLILFFSINGYIQAAKSDHRFNQADRDRTKLIHAQNRISKSVKNISHSSRNQTDLIRQLQDALRRQNQLLREHGIQTVVIPGESNSPPSGPNSNPGRGNDSGSNNHHKKKHHHHYNGGGNGDHPGPLDPVTNKVCELTGICTILSRSENVNLSNRQQQTVRRTEVYCASGTASFWGAIFCAIADLGFV